MLSLSARTFLKKTGEAAAVNIDFAGNHTCLIMIVENKNRAFWRVENGEYE